jgi:hypothetical protein
MLKTTQTPPSPDDLRSALAFFDVPVYIVAARVHIHPLRLGQMLRGRRPLPAELAELLLVEIETVAKARQ